MRTLSLLLLTVLAFATPATAQDRRTSFSIYGGKMTENGWHEVFFKPWLLEARDHNLAGVSVTRERPLGSFGYIGIEGQVTRHWGEQEYWEFVAPVYVRSQRPEKPYFPSLAYGLGLSYVTEEPIVEIERRGQTQKLLAYWFVEFEFGGVDATVNPYIRVHHRSDAYGLFENDTSSNAIVVGLRRDFGRKGKR